MGINREPCPKPVFPQQGDRLGIAWGGVPLTSVGVSQSPFLAFPSLLPVAVGSGTRMGKSKDLGGFFFLIYLFIVTFRFLVFGFTGKGGTLPTVPHWSLIPQTLLFPNTNLLKHLY